MKKVKILLKYGLICTCALISIALGVFCGNLITSKNFTINKYANVLPDDLRDDVSKIKYEGKKPNQLSGIEAYLVSISNLTKLDYYERISFGNIETSLGVNQTTNARNIKNFNNYTQEFCTLSSVIKNAGIITFQEGSDVLIQYGTPKGPTLNEVDWGNKTETFSFDEFIENIGQNPTIESPYIVSTKTTLSQSECTISNNTYSFSLTLEPNLSNLCTINKMAFLSGIDKNSISFSYVKIDFTMDENFKMISESYTEEYTLKYGGVPVTLNGSYQITYNY